jgi:DNA-directed RNA polymerase
MRVSIGKGLGKIPPEALDLEEPPKPDTDDPKARSVYLQRMNQIHVARANNHSDRCSVNYKLEVARAVSFFLSFLSPLRS